MQKFKLFCNQAPQDEFKQMFDVDDKYVMVVTVVTPVMV